MDIYPGVVRDDNSSRVGLEEVLESKEVEFEAVGSIHVQHEDFIKHENIALAFGSRRLRNIA